MNKHQTILILDFGGQYKELIARRVRECAVYSIVRAGDISAREVRELSPIGIILTGGPNSVYLPESPHCDPEIFTLGIPVLGICYGASCWPIIWRAGSSPPPTLPPGNTARPRPFLTRTAPSSGVCPARASPG